MILSAELWTLWILSLQIADHGINRIVNSSACVKGFESLRGGKPGSSPQRRASKPFNAYLLADYLLCVSGLKHA